MHLVLHKEPQHKCTRCDKAFVKASLLERHVRRNHEIQTENCEFCGKLMNVLQMPRHVKEFHSGLTKQKCPVGGKKIYQEFFLI